jgi:hypothetical protein
MFGVPAVVAVMTLLAYQQGGLALAAMIFALVATVLAILAFIFRPRWWGTTRVQAISIIVYGSIVIAALSDQFWHYVFAAFYEGIQLRYPDVLPFIDIQFLIDDQLGLRVVILASITIILLHFIWSRHQILPPTDVRDADTDTPFPVKDYELLRDEFCKSMVHVLDQDDQDLDWSDVYYSRLEAEIELEKQSRRGRRIAKDLVEAIKADHSSRVFLLLGDPGSGKSVSLRRLCRQLYKRVPDSDIIPVYINLRAWDGPDAVTDSDITEFVLRHLVKRAGRAGGTFLKEWYLPLLDHGKFFFIFDSFDEMPAVLDCDDSSMRHKEISKAFDTFFHDIHNCRGVLASRRFRQPRGFQARVLSIRPFSERQIRGAMGKWMTGKTIDGQAIIKKIFGQPSLAPAIRNPFLADLITHYVVRNNGEMPASLFEVFDSYIRGRLNDDLALPGASEFEVEQILESATTIAWRMYSSPQIGLEASLGILNELVDIEGFNRVITTLKIARIARVGGSQNPRFSFVHRRFAEFLVARALLSGAHTLPLESIPADSRWRDCMVFYCNVASEPQATEIARFCWEIIEASALELKMGDWDSARPAIHALRFLRDSFGSRPHLLQSFSQELSRLVVDCLSSTEVLTAKLAAESLGIVTPSARTEGIVLALRHNSRWVRETAFLSCRNLAGLEPEAKRAIRRHIQSIPVPQFIRSYRDLMFSLNLSDDLASQRYRVTADLVSILAVWFGAVLVCGATVISVSPPGLLLLPNMLMFVLLAALEHMLAQDLLNLSSGNRRLFANRAAHLAMRDLNKFFRFLAPLNLKSLMVASLPILRPYDLVFRFSLFSAAVTGIFVSLVSPINARVLLVPVQLTRSLSPPPLEISVPSSGFAMMLAQLDAAIAYSLSVRVNFEAQIPYWWDSLAFFGALLLVAIPWAWWGAWFDGIRRYGITSLYRGSKVMTTSLVAGVHFVFLSVLILAAIRWVLYLISLVPFGLLLIGFLMVVMAVGPVGYTALLIYRDWNTVASLQIQEQTSRSWISEIVESLHFRRSRAHFLRELQLHRVQLTSDSAADWGDVSWQHHFQEELARLESMWRGLDD